MKGKIEQLFLQWKQNPDRKPLVVKGCRQCGKTYSVLSFARANYEHVSMLRFYSKAIEQGEQEVSILHYSYWCACERLLGLSAMD